jgi:F420-dependent oxidoreductase-like protein
MPLTPKFGVFVPQGWKMDLVTIPDPVEKYEAMTRVAQAADKLGFESIWVYDHFHTVPRPTLETTFEAWTITAALARDTQNIRIGQMVTCNGYRNPAYLAKVASTVDVLSHGRLDFGIGAGWYEHEWRAYGYGFPDAPTRLKMLADALPIIKAMWTEDYATYEGKYHQVNGAINEPKGVQKPHPPIWIGGGGEKVTLKLVAQYGDAANFGGMDVELFRHKAEILRQHCEKLGRDYNTIIKSTGIDAFLLEPSDVERAEELSEPYRAGLSFDDWRKGRYVGPPSGLVSVIEQLMDAGAGYFLIYLAGVATNHTPLEMLKRDVVGVLGG